MMVRLPDEMLRAMQVQAPGAKWKPDRKPWHWPRLLKAKPMSAKPRMA